MTRIIIVAEDTFRTLLDIFLESLNKLNSKWIRYSNVIHSHIVLHLHNSDDLSLVEYLILIKKLRYSISIVRHGIHFYTSALCYHQRELKSKMFSYFIQISAKVIHKTGIC